MAHILEQISEMRPVFRVSDRETTLDFYTSVLGLTLLKEENGILSFSGSKESHTRITCIVSPESLDFHSAAPQKRHLLTILSYEQEDVKHLLSKNLANDSSRIERVTHSSSFGYGFTAVSADGDAFVVQSGEDSETIELSKDKITSDELFSSADSVTDLEVVSTMLCSPNGMMFYQQKLAGAYIHPVPMEFENSEDTWDIESAKFILKAGVGLYELLFDLEGIDYMIDNNTKTLSIKAPDGFELQFTEAAEGEK